MIRIVLIVIVCAGMGCASRQTESTPFDDRTFLLNRAVDLRDDLKSQGFTCLEKGRELYPELFDCTNQDSLGIYLYADDRGRLEGIRGFGPGNTEWIRIPLSLIYDVDVVDSISTALSSPEVTPSRIFRGSHLLEWESSGVHSILRISPRSAIRN